MVQAAADCLPGEDLANGPDDKLRCTEMCKIPVVKWRAIVDSPGVDASGMLSIEVFRGWQCLDRLIISLARQKQVKPRNAGVLVENHWQSMGAASCPQLHSGCELVLRMW